MNHHQFVEFDFDKYPIQLKTDSEIGSGDSIDMCLYTSEETNVKNCKNVGFIWIKFSDPMKYKVYECVSEWKTFNVAVPEGNDKIWEIVKTTSELRIYCNSIEVVKIEFEQVRPIAKP